MIEARVYGGRGQVLLARLFPYEVDLLEVSKRFEFYVQAEDLSREYGPCAVSVHFLPARRFA